MVRLDEGNCLPFSLDKLTLEDGTDRYTETSSTSCYSVGISRATSKNRGELVLPLTNKGYTFVNKIYYIILYNID
jgi:hypothetical protein